MHLFVDSDSTQPYLYIQSNVFLYQDAQVPIFDTVLAYRYRQNMVQFYNASSLKIYFLVQLSDD